MAGQVFRVPDNLDLQTRQAFKSQKVCLGVACQGSVVSALCGWPVSLITCEVSLGYIQIGTGNMKFIEVFADVTVQRKRCTFLLKPINAQGF